MGKRRPKLNFATAVSASHSRTKRKERRQAPSMHLTLLACILASGPDWSNNTLLNGRQLGGPSAFLLHATTHTCTYTIHPQHTTGPASSSLEVHVHFHLHFVRLFLEILKNSWKLRENRNGNESPPPVHCSNSISIYYQAPNHIDLQKEKKKSRCPPLVLSS